MKTLELPVPSVHVNDPETITQDSSHKDDGTFSVLFRRIALLSSGTALSHLVLILVSPVLTRIYAPSDFAMFGFYQSILAILSLTLTMQYEQAIAIQKTDEDARTVHQLSMRLGVSLAVILSLISFFLVVTGRMIWSWLSPLIVLILPLCALGEACSRTYRFDAVRYAQFSTMTVSRLILAIATVAGQIGLAFTGLSGIGLALGDGIGRWVSMVPFLFSHHRRPLSMATSSKPSMTKLARTYSRFPIMLTPAAILMLVICTAPAFVLPGLYGEDFAGQFNLANRCVLLPMMIISQAVTHVFISDASKLIREKNGSLTVLMAETLKRMTFMGTGLALCAACSGPVVFPILFGEQWVLAGQMVPVIAIAGLAQFICGPVIQTLVLLQEEVTNLIVHICSAMIVLGGIFGTHALGGSPLQAVIAFVLGMCVYTAVMCVQAFICAGRKSKSWNLDHSVERRIPAPHYT